LPKRLAPWKSLRAREHLRWAQISPIKFPGKPRKEDYVTAQQKIAAGNMAIARGLYHEAQRHFTEAIELSKDFAQQDPMWGEIHRGLAQVYLQSSKPQEAEAAAETALKTDEAFFGAGHIQNAVNWFLLGDALRMKGDFERAESAYQRSKRMLEREFGVNHEQTSEVFSRLIVLYLESGQEFGFEQLHKEALATFQMQFPTGTWTKFIKLKELIEDYCARDQFQHAEGMLKREAAVLARLLGKNHKEVQAVMQLQSELLKDQRRLLASWRVSTQSAKMGVEGNEQLFLSEVREYAVPLDDCRSVIERMLSMPAAVSANAPTILHQQWWQTEMRRQNNQEVIATLKYVENVQDPRHKARLKVTARFTKRGPKTHVSFDCTLQNSSRMSLARDLVRFTIDEIDQTLAIVPSNIIAGANELRAVSIPAEGFWPTPQQFNEALQNPKNCFGPLELRDALPEVNQLGLPRPCSGAFATVYRMGGMSGDWAIKCFTQRVTDEQTRYKAISARILQANLPYFVQFQYITEGICINNDWFPIVQMNWVEAKSLSIYVSEYLHEPAVLNGLANAFVRMVDELQQAGIAHGDLQHGNVLVHDKQIVLVDYDGMWVPELAKLNSRELGHRNFQHPGRTKEHFGAHLDNFAGWLIYCSLNCLAQDPSLWESLQGGDDCLLLRYEDLANPQQSQRLAALANHQNEEIRNQARIISRLLAVPFEKVPTFSRVFSA
jgi:tetratricopeptide (TPR) repeat protein